MRIMTELASLSCGNQMKKCMHRTRGWAWNKCSSDDVGDDEDEEEE